MDVEHAPDRTLELIFAAVIRDDAMPVRSRTRASCVGWDSVAHINLVLSIEQEFGIVLREDDTLDLTSFDSALKIVEERLRSR